MRRNGKRDANHSQIRDAYVDAGCSVLDLANMGGGVPDLLVAKKTAPCPHCGVDSRTFLSETKDGSKPPSARLLTPDQVKFSAKWTGELWVVKTQEEALNVVWGVRRER